MMKNKVNVLVDGIPTMALVDTGAAVCVELRLLESPKPQGYVFVG